MSKHTFTKSVIIAGLALLSSSSVLANHRGFYGGVALGGAVLTGKSNLSVSRINPLGFLQPNNFGPRLSDGNVTGDFFIGYGKRLNCFWVAVEAIASLTSLNSKASLDLSDLNTGQFLSAKTTNAWIGAVNLGRYLNESIKVYVKLGIESRRFRVNFTGVPNPAADPLVNLNKTYTSVAFVPGLGMEVDLTPRFSLRTEYRGAFHQAKTVQVTQSATTYTSVKTTPVIHSFTVGFTVKI
jgi:opacity protein-like surface antigen